MKSVATSVAIAALILVPAWSAADALVFEGIARDQQGQVVYREKHTVEGQCDDGHWRPRRQQVAYRRPGESGAFATKELAYPGSLLRPEVAFRQPDFGEQLTIRRAGDDTLRVRLSLKEAEGDTWSLAITPKLVVDAGFDHFVRAHWDRLTGGESVEFPILAPTRGKAYDFVAEPAPEPVGGADHSFRIRPAGLVMRLAVDPIHLGYRADGLLTHYSGLGNIRRNEDENYVVALRYRATETPGCSLLPER